MCRLESFASEDIERAISWIPDAKALLAWAGPNCHCPLDRQQIADSLEKANKPDSNCHMLKFVLDDDSVAGHIELFLPDKDKTSAHVGRVLIDPLRRGKRLGTELIRLAKRYGSERLGLA